MAALTDARGGEGPRARRGAGRLRRRPAQGAARQLGSERSSAAQRVLVRTAGSAPTCRRARPRAWAPVARATTGAAAAARARSGRATRRTPSSSGRGTSRGSGLRARLSCSDRWRNAFSTARLRVRALSAQRIRLRSRWAQSRGQGGAKVAGGAVRGEKPRAGASNAGSKKLGDSSWRDQVKERLLDCTAPPSLFLHPYVTRSPPSLTVARPFASSFHPRVTPQHAARGCPRPRQRRSPEPPFSPVAPF